MAYKKKQDFQAPPFNTVEGLKEWEKSVREINKKFPTTRTSIFSPTFWNPIIVREPRKGDAAPPRNEWSGFFDRRPRPGSGSPAHQNTWGPNYGIDGLRKELLLTPTQLRESHGGFSSAPRRSDAAYSEEHRERVAGSFKRLRAEAIEHGFPNPTTAPQPKSWPQMKRWLQDGRPPLLDLSQDYSREVPLLPMGVIHKQSTSPEKLKELHKELSGYVPYSLDKKEKQWLAEYKATGLGSQSKAMGLKPMLLDEKTGIDYSRQFSRSGQWPQKLQSGNPSADSISPREKSMHESGGPPVNAKWYRQQVLLDHKRDKSLDTPAVTRQMAHYEQLHALLKKQDKGARALLNVFHSGRLGR